MRISRHKRSIPLANHGNTTNKKKVKGVDPNFDYKTYWEQRYSSGKNSGTGSYGDNAKFKADIIDRLILENDIKSIIDFGSGDGNQISLIKSKVTYLGYDVSETAINTCRKKFKNQQNMDFELFNPVVFDYSTQADMTMALDMLFHVTKEDEWLKTIDCVCQTSNNLILIVTNTEVIPEDYFPHVNFKRKILPVLDNREDVVIEEVITQPTHRESNAIILRKKHG